MRLSILRSAFIALLAISACACVSSSAQAVGRLALVMGNSKYQAAPTLDNPSNDAADLAQRLRSIGFDVIEVRDATRESMANAVREFSERIRNADMALFFFAGHGLQMGGENYLVPVDAKIESEADVRFNTINLADIQQEMAGSGRASIIILDACRNNPFAEKLAHSGRGIATRGLGRVEATGVGSLIVFSTQPNNVALDGVGRNSPFMSALLKHIDAPGLEVRQMISRVRGDVLQATDQKQVPWDNSSLVGDVYLAGAPATTASNAAPAAPAQPVAPAQPASAPAIAPREEAVANATGPAADCKKMATPAPPFASPEQIKKANLMDLAAAVAPCQRAVDDNPHDPHLQYLLGRAFDGAKNYLEAARRYQIAAEAGDAQAQGALGYYFVTGKGVVKDYQRAFDLFNKAALAGEPTAMGNVGAMYSNGFFVKEDDAQALAWYERSIEAGNSFGLAQAGVMYFNGKGTERDYNAAAQYFEQAADMGDGYSLKFLAIMYERGLLGNPDPAKAAQLRLKAAEIDPNSQNPNVPPPQKTAVRTAHSGGVHYIRIRHYRFFGCNWLWC